MSIDHFEIVFSITSPKIAERVSNCISKRMKEECKLEIANSNITGFYYSSEHDEEYDDWEPSKKLPSGFNVFKWVLDVMNHGSMINSTGEKELRNNIGELEASIEDYDIMHHKCSPEDYGSNWVCYQKYDGKLITSYEMGSYNWECMWDKNNADKAKAIFEKYGLDMQDYHPKKSFIGDTFDYLKERLVFMDLLEEFGDRKTSEKRLGDEEEIMQDEIEALLSKLKQWVVSPETIDFNGKKIGLNVYEYDAAAGDDEDVVQKKEFIRNSISRLGGTYSSADVNTATDIAILIRYPEAYCRREHVRKYKIAQYYNMDSIEKVTHHLTEGGYTVEKLISDKEYRIGVLGVYKEYLKKFVEAFTESNDKRINKKNPKPAINIVYEDQWMDYLKGIDKI